MNFHQRIRSVRSSLNWTIGYRKAAIITVLILAVVLLGYQYFRVPLTADHRSGSDNKSASITTADGYQIPLANDKYGIIMTGSQLLYNDGASISGSKSRNDFLSKTRLHFSAAARDYMILRSPAERMLHVTLPDSSKIWLAANSSLVIPSDFNKKGNRVIRLSGEAYFDVTGVTAPAAEGGKKVPFTVLSNGQRTEVYGTRFNLSAYPSRSVVSTSLYNGKLVITPLKEKSAAPFLSIPNDFNSPAIVTGKPFTLLPNQVASLSYDNLDIEVAKGKEIVEWDNDEVIFRNTPVEKILTIVAAWYNLSVVYKTKGKEKTLIGGSAVRVEKLSDILQTLTLTAEIKFKQNGNRITVYE